MVHGVRLREGKAEWYRNRWVRSAKVAQALGESVPLTDWPMGHMDSAANTNVIGHAGGDVCNRRSGGPPIELGFELTRSERATSRERCHRRFRRTQNVILAQVNFMPWPTGGAGGTRCNI